MGSRRATVRAPSADEGARSTRRIIQGARYHEMLSEGDSHVRQADARFGVRGQGEMQVPSTDINKNFLAVHRVPRNATYDIRTAGGVRKGVASFLLSGRRRFFLSPQSTFMPIDWSYHIVTTAIFEAGNKCTSRVRKVYQSFPKQAAAAQPCISYPRRI
jgi:hypothetical protein